MKRAISILKKISLIIFFILPVFNHTFGQDAKKYTELVTEAYQLYKSKEYLKSAQKYNEAFAVFGNKAITNDRYNAACSWALANEMDSAFVLLFKIAVNDKYSNIEHITKDVDFNSIHNDLRWAKIIEIVTNNKEKAEVNFDKTLVAILDTVYQDDQKYRLELDTMIEKYGWNSAEIKAQWKIINEKDSINLVKIKKILEERGWLGVDIIGVKGNTTLFLVIQHANRETQEKYLPVMREAVKKGNAKAQNLAYLEDRVALRKGEKQIYGSQITHRFATEDRPEEIYVRPLIDPDNVDKRRAEVGLGSIQEILSQYGLIWDAEEYKKKLPEYEEKEWGKNKK